VRVGTHLIVTSRGPARVELTRPGRAPRAWLVLGHGAGGDVTAPDLIAVRDAALHAGVAVALVTQPYRVAGRRSPAPATHLDEAWTTVVGELDRGKLPLVTGGRSSGARVACRTAEAVGAAAVVALAFPLQPPGRAARPDGSAAPSRADELLTGLPTLVVNGDRDPFGVPAASPGVDVVVIPGARHDLRRDTAAVGAAVVEWLRRHDLAR
jgi:hypothetical protein